jgi:tRNA threonylcarbamoyl adenosine modification protein YeaZ
MNNAEGNLMLALETGIDGGSVAVLSNGISICRAQGAGNVSRSEDLLLLIDELLEKNDLPKARIKFVSVSDSPGSLTGIRIGLATAAGLGAALNAEVYKFSLLEALLMASPAKHTAISAIGSEKGGVYYRKFRFTKGVWAAENDILNERDPEAFASLLQAENEQNTEIVVGESIAARIFYLPDPRFAEKDAQRVAIVNRRAATINVVEGNLAETLGRAASIKYLRT